MPSQSLDEILADLGTKAPEDNGAGTTKTATKKGKASTKAALSSEPIVLEQLKRETMLIPILGLTPVIQHKWSEKNLRMMREKQQGTKVGTKKDPKNPIEDAELSTYYLYTHPTTGELVDEQTLIAEWLEEGVIENKAAGVERLSPLEKFACIPAAQFKAAMVGALRLHDGPTMVSMKPALFVHGEDPISQLIRINYGKRTLREDPVRNQTGVADLRYRYAYWPWSLILKVTYVASVLDRKSVLALVNTAGMGGIGDWRPTAPKSPSGTFGTFEVDTSKEIKVIS